MPVRLILYGKDAALLQTRRGVLESAGFEASVATRPAEIERILLSGRIDLLLLCHTLSSEQCELALRCTLECNPEVKAIVFASNGTMPPRRGLYDGSFDPLEGPGALIAAVTCVLADRDAYSRPSLTPS